MTAVLITFASDERTLKLKKMYVERHNAHKCLAFKRRSRPGLELDEIGMGPVN